MIIQKVEANASRHQKKRYTGPILSEHGKVTDLTKGSGGSNCDAKGTFDKVGVGEPKDCD